MTKYVYDFPKLPETATVSYFNEAEWNKGLTPQEIQQQQEIANWQNQLGRNEKGYGPCPDMWNESDSAHTFDSGFEALAVSTKGRIESGLDDRAHVSAGADLSVFRYRDGTGDLKLFSYSASAQAGIGENGASAGYKLGVDLASVKAGGTKVNVGVDFGSQASIGEGSLKAKVGGVGVSIGKEIGFSTPIGGLSINLEEVADNCTIQ